MTGPRAAAFARSIVLLTVLVVGAPWLLTWIAHRRFDGPAPWSGVDAANWRWADVRSALTERLTEATLADLVVRAGLAAAWIAILVLFATVVAETVHMAHHAGLPLPSVRGLGATQHLARVIAAGLLVAVPLVGQVREVVALDATALRRSTPAGAFPGQEASFDRALQPSTGEASVGASGPLGGAWSPATAVSTAAEAEYVVRTGDSIYGIAERMAGPERRAVADYADRLLDLNLGRVMDDGQRFTNAAYIEVGWTLHLPGPTAVPIAAAGAGVTHVVERGETLWSIATDELGDGERWPEIFGANRGRTFEDGRVFDDPDLIRPGWELVVPTGDHVAPDTTDAADARADSTVEVASSPTIDSTTAATSESASEAEIDRGDAPSDAHDEPQHRPGRISRAEADVAVESSELAPDNAWITREPPVDAVDVGDPAAGRVGVGEATVVDTTSTTTSPAGVADDDADERWNLLTFRNAAMLSAGVLTLLAVRRRDRLRRGRPHARVPVPAAAVAATELALRQIGTGERFARVDLAIRAAASSLVEQSARVQAVVVAADGELELHASTSVSLDQPWEPTSTSTTWRLPASTPIELFAPCARRVGAPCPTLVQLGRDLAERDVYVDLEALEAIEVGGSAGQANAIVAAVATTLASSVLAEVVTLVGLDVPDDAFLEHRHHQPAEDARRAFEVATAAIGTTGHAERSTFELRTRVAGGEAWEPAVVFAGAAVGAISPPRDRTGLAVVSASPIHGPSSRLAPDDDGWTLLPLGLRLVPIGLSTADIDAIAELVNVPPVEQADDRDVTIVDADVDELSGAGGRWSPDGSDRMTDADPELAHALVVRLLGPVAVESRDGEPVEFERSKTRELIAWLATHRDRATRSNARAALWELDVRDATFANVVSEARRAMARCVEPPDGEEWVGRTMNEQLPLHDLVVTDVDLLERALEMSRLEPPERAIEVLRPAVDRIVGLPFDGTAYLWPDAEGITSAIVMRAITATSELASHCLSIGDIEGVFAASSAGLRVLPAHEEMIAVRMRAYAQIGDRAGVRSEWETYERAITADPWSDGEPSPRMLELRRELLAGQ